MGTLCMASSHHSGNNPHLSRRRRLNQPPGPTPWPIIGNFNLIGSLPHRSFHELSKKYGPIMMLHFGSVPVLVGSSLEIAKLFLKTYDIIFSGRPKTSAGKYTTYNYSNITWSQYGPYFRQARKICLNELFSSKRLESYEYIRVEELNLALRGTFDTKGEPILLKDYLSSLSLNVICRMVLGKSYLDNNDDENEGNLFVTKREFKKMLDELFLLNWVFNIGDWIPLFKHFDVQGYVKRMKILGKKFDIFMEHVLDEHNARRENLRKIGSLKIWWMCYYNLRMIQILRLKLREMELRHILTYNYELTYFLCTKINDKYSILENFKINITYTIFTNY